MMKEYMVVWKTGETETYCVEDFDAMYCQIPNINDVTAIIRIS